MIVNCSINEDAYNKYSGSWISLDDSPWILVMKDNVFEHKYGEEVVSRCTYAISKKSCNEIYSTEQATYLFLHCKNDETECYEVTGLSDTLLFYRETVTGKLSGFRRLR